MRPTVLLFDIDGTLILSGGAGRRSMGAAFLQETGHDDVFADFRFGGMTDLGIVRAGLEKVGRSFDQSLVTQILETYLSILPREIAGAGQYRVLPGVVPVLDAVADIDGVAVGLGTGNVERGARVKLGRADLADRYSFGGFGCDAENRVALLIEGARRGAARLSLEVAECRVVVIGDTPRDVAAARAMNAECVAIGTGGHSVSELVALAPEAAFADLTDPSALRAILHGRS